MQLLQSDISLDDVRQSGEVSDEVLDRLLDRRYLNGSAAPQVPPSGIGYEFVQNQGSTNMISIMD